MEPYCDSGISVAEDVPNRGLCLTSDTKMTDKDIYRIISIIKGVFNEKEFNDDVANSTTDTAGGLVNEEYRWMCIGEH